MISKRHNGFSWPLDKAQIISWILLIYVGLIFFSSYSLSLSSPASYVITSIFAIIYITTCILILCVSSINPGEDAALAKRGRIVPQQATSFDRKKHKHVIENQFCNICQITVSFKAKHCKRCNKCVTNFDHHCIYLNNCIGSKNYKIFILTITSLSVGSFFVFLIGLIEFICSFSNESSFLTQNYFKCNHIANCTDDLKYFPIFVPVALNAWRSVIMITTVLTFASFSLISYLLGYHYYLYLNKMTTYEHTVKIRLKEDEKGMKKSILMSKMTDKSDRELHHHHHQLPSISSTLPLPPIKIQNDVENEHEDIDIRNKQKFNNFNYKHRERWNQLDINETKEKSLTNCIQTNEVNEFNYFSILNDEANMSRCNSATNPTNTNQSRENLTENSEQTFAPNSHSSSRAKIHNRSVGESPEKLNTSTSSANSSNKNRLAINRSPLGQNIVKLPPSIDYVGQNKFYLNEDLKNLKQNRNQFRDEYENYGFNKLRRISKPKLNENFKKQLSNDSENDYEEDNDIIFTYKTHHKNERY